MPYKKLLATLIALAVCIPLGTSFPNTIGSYVTVSANTLTTDDGLEYTFHDGVVITGYSGSSTHVTIPSTISNVPVVSIADNAFDSSLPSSNPALTKIKSISIPDSVVTIGFQAFYDCTALESVNIPYGVTSNSELAFSGCESLKSITIPNSVKYVWNGAFAGCKSLTSISFPDSVVLIGSQAFGSCTSLESVRLSNNLGSIADGAFLNCSALKSVTIPNGVDWIYSSAFNGCTSLESVTIPSTVTNINAFAFSDCDSLTDVYYGGTEDAWNDITILDFESMDTNAQLTDANVHYESTISNPIDASSIYSDVNGDGITNVIDLLLLKKLLLGMPLT